MMRLSGSVKLRCALGLGVPSGRCGGTLRGRSASAPGGGGSRSSSSNRLACWSRFLASVAASARLAGVRVMSSAFLRSSSACSRSRTARASATSFLSASRTRAIFASRSSRRRISSCGSYVPPSPFEPVLLLVRRLCALEPLLDLGAQARLILLHPLVTHSLVLARVRLHLGAVDRHVAKPHKPL